ncbi:MAG: hypothetical protein C4322_20915, partial [Mastigocladus sp. ERB_26_1]
KSIKLLLKSLLQEFGKGKGYKVKGFLFSFTLTPITFSRLMPRSLINNCTNSSFSRKVLFFWLYRIVIAADEHVEVINRQHNTRKYFVWSQSTNLIM